MIGDWTRATEKLSSIMADLCKCFIIFSNNRVIPTIDHILCNFKFTQQSVQMIQTKQNNVQTSVLVGGRKGRTIKLSINCFWR